MAFEVNFQMAIHLVCSFGMGILLINWAN